MKTNLFILTLFLLPFLSSAKVTVPACIADDMVLQQNTKVNIWGNAAAGRSVTVIPSWDKKQYKTTADKAGNWKVNISTPQYGGPYTLELSDGEPLVIKNILIGEVWVCSGQSNMEMQLAGFYGNVLNIDQEVATANYPQIRMLKVATTFDTKPHDDLKTVGGWATCSPATVKDFSAVAYFFAREIYKNKHVPIGIINTTWGGTVAEAWMSGDAVKKMPAFAPIVQGFEKGVSQEELNKRYDAILRNWINTIHAKDPYYKNGKLTWVEKDFDNTGWGTMKLPGFWEQGPMPEYDGTVAFRKKITVPANWAGKDLKLDLGSVDDADVTWFNGVEVGHTELFLYKRSYVVPGNLVQAGQNTIAIRVLDGGGLGGFNQEGPFSLSLVSDPNAKISIEGEWAYKTLNPLIDIPEAPSKPEGANRATLIYNTMVNPIVNYTIKGVIWYQGESNAGRAYQYRELFPLLIKNWRAKWGQGDFPFYFVQLANYMPKDKMPSESAWAELREAQTKTLALPNTGMAVAIDIGDTHNIHPANKQEVGRRLALIALANIYGKKINYHGPMYSSVKYNEGEAEVTFNHAGGLKYTGDKLTGFTIAGADKKFYPADARIEKGKVIVRSKQVSNPVAVRYGWANNPDCNLYNADELPAVPFRTDSWPGITMGRE